MTEKLLWFRFYPLDFLGSRMVKSMRPEDVGYYMKLLCHEWDGGPLPLDNRELANLLGISPRTMVKVWKGVGKCFVETEDGYVNERLETIREEQLELVEKRRKAGSQGAARRWKGQRKPSPPTTDGADSNANGTPNGNANSKATDLPMAVGKGRKGLTQSSSSSLDPARAAKPADPTRVTLPSIPSADHQPEVIRSRIETERRKLEHLAAQPTGPPGNDD